MFDEVLPKELLSQELHGLIIPKQAEVTICWADRQFFSALECDLNEIVRINEASKEIHHIPLCLEQFAGG